MSKVIPFDFFKGDNKMFTTKEEFLEWLANHSKFSMKLHLTRIKRACELLGNPELKLKTLHIAGTNGKGSTVNYLNHLLMASGFRVGIYISPYIICFNERIQINNEYISDADLVLYANKIYEIVNQVEQELNDDMTEFEIVTLLSYLYFYEKQVDYVIYEVGLGGRYDATNLIIPIAGGITNISYDHMNVLGDTLEKIGYEKIGIAKPNIPIFTTETNESVLKVFQDYCAKVGSKLIICNHKEIINPEYSDEGMKFTYKNLKLSIPMLGYHQLKNVLLALKMYEYAMNHDKIIIKDEYIYNGLKNAKWIGRLEVICKKPLIIIDGSHNIDGVKTLVEAMKHFLTEGYKINTVFAALKDKDTKPMLELLQSISTELILTSFNFYRANTAKNLYEQTNKENVSYDEDYEHVLKAKINTIKDDELLLVTGSLYFISNVISFLKCIDIA